MTPEKQIAALEQEVATLRTSNEKLTKDLEAANAAEKPDVKKLKADIHQLEVVVKDQARELKALGASVPDAPPVVKHKDKHYKVIGGAIIDGVKMSAKTIAAKPAVLAELIKNNSGLVQELDA